MSLSVFLANYAIWILAVASAWLIIRRRFRVLTHCLLSSSIAGLVGALLKSYFYLPRPFIVTQVPPKVDYILDGAFPSNHTGITVAFSLALFTYYPRLGLILLVSSLLIGTSRVVVGVHYPVDIIGGLIISVISAYISGNIVRRAHRTGTDLVRIRD